MWNLLEMTGPSHFFSIPLSPWSKTQNPGGGNLSFNYTRYILGIFLSIPLSPGICVVVIRLREMVVKTPSALCVTEVHSNLFLWYIAALNKVE